MGTNISKYQLVEQFPAIYGHLEHNIPFWKEVSPFAILELLSAGETLGLTDSGIVLNNFRLIT